MVTVSLVFCFQRKNCKDFYTISKITCFNNAIRIPKMPLRIVKEFKMWPVDVVLHYHMQLVYTKPNLVIINQLTAQCQAQLP